MTTTTRRRPQRRVWPVTFLAAAVAGAWAAAGGCTTSSSRPTTRPASWTQQAQNDPFNYNPSATEDWPSVSGGGIGHFDKDEFKRDLDNVLNP